MAYHPYPESVDAMKAKLEAAQASRNAILVDETTLTRRAQLDRLEITEQPHISFGAVFAVAMAAGVAAIGIFGWLGAL